MEATRSGIGARVKAQYEAFPYPHYSLLLPLRSQEAYASNSLFAARLLETRGMRPAVRAEAAPGILLAGCGDVFPYLASFWEPRAHRLAALDLSARSLRRARLRCLPRLRGIEWIRGNLDDTDRPLPGGLAHIDSYGVLHHLSDPALVLGRFSRSLLPGGTARIMVYNSEARSWIRHLQKAFSLLGLSAFRREDRDGALQLIRKTAAVSPALTERFAQLPADSLGNPARFVDTFLHAREARLGLDYWLDAIAAAGLEPLGLFDRYGELDDLPNPLLRPPSREAWRERIADRRFENNLELFLCKPGNTAAGRSGARGLPAPHFLKAPPAGWFGYPETSRLPRLARYRLWSHFLRGLAGGAVGPMDSWAGRLGHAALGRLARIGAVFPGDFASAELREALLSPLQASMEPPDFAPAGSVFADRGIRAEVVDILRKRNRDGQYLEAVMRRLDAAQRP